MYGLKQQTKRAVFEFDLEKDLQDRKKNEELLDRVEKRIHEIKNKLREGADSKEFDGLGLLLHGYSSLHKVLTRAAKN